MNGRPGASIVLVLVLVATSSLALAERPKATQQTPVTVTCDVVEIWASHGKSGTDGSIPKALGKRLSDNFKYTEYKQLSSTSKTFEKKKTEAIKLQKGSASITLVEIVDKSNVRLAIDFKASKGKSTGTFTVAGGDWLPTLAKESSKPDADGHVLAVGNCK